MERRRVVGMGNACLDTLLEVERLPERGERVAVLSRRQSPGGQAAGAMVGCARLGMESVFLLRTGDDAAGVWLRAALREMGVDLDHSRVIAGTASATAYILRDRSGQRSVIWNTPAALAVRAEEITPALFEGADAVFLDGKDGAACLRAAQLARERGLPVIADLDCHYAHTEELLPWIGHLIVPAEFGMELGAPHPGVVVVTRGGAGAVGWEAGGEPVHAPAYPVAVVDTTGAGDAFHAGYIHALLEGWRLAERLRFANATAALACTAVGAQAGLPTRAEVEGLLGVRGEG